MAIPSKQIGWSQESNLLWEISRQMDQLTNVASASSGGGGISSLNTLTAPSQTFATGTSGSDFNIDSNTATHTFNLPNASPSTRGALISSDYSIFSDNITITAYKILGSSIKGLNVVVPQTSMMTSSIAFGGSGTFRFVAIYVPQSTVVTGAIWYPTVTGNYTAINYNGIGLYSYDGVTGDLTLIASTANDGNIWKGSATIWKNKAFSSPQSLSPGIYYLGFLFSTSGIVTQPAFGGMLTGGAGNTFDFLSKPTGIDSSGYTSLPSTISTLGFSNTNSIGMWLY